MATSATTLPDSQLVTCIAEGNQTAEGALYEKYSDRILYLALSERCSRDEAEDVRAETFLRVIQSLRDGKLHKPDSLASFIVGIALNVMRERKRQTAGTDTLTDRADEIAGSQSPEETIVDQEESRLISACAAKLKSRDRDFLRMYFYEELPKAEIARALGIKEERLRLIKSRALKRFEEIYSRLKRSDT
jgi:RNA polymerase sigma factor (sigma-70 family)